MGVKIKGMKNLQKQLNSIAKNPSSLIKEVEVECPKCHRKLKVSTSGTTTCSCGQKIISG